MSWASAVRQAPAKTKAKAIVSSFMPATFKPAPIDWGRLVSLDFETYYDVGYTLSTLSTSSYVRDPRFEALMVGIKIGRGKTKVVPRDKIAAELKKINWGTHSLLCHNVQFDGFIMSERYGVIPKQYYCTLSMARALHSNEVGAGLHDVSMFYGGAGKLEGGVENMKGKSFDTLWADKPLWSASAAYCVNDVDEMFRIFQEMHDKMPPNELQLVHMTARMFCAPVLRIDIPRVEAEYVREVESREKLLLGMLDPRKYDDKTTLKTGAERKLEGKDRDMLIAKRVIGSNEKFKTLLLDAGLPENKIPMKVSPAFIKKSPEEKALVVGEDKWTYAFAKDDLDFTSLPDRVWSIFGYDQEDASDVIRATTRSAQLQELVDARIAVKSTTNITRAERFMEAGKDGMLLPVGYSYYRAHCLTGGAQVLTRSGWVALADWQGGEIAQWSPDGTIKFALATANAFEVHENLVQADSRYHGCTYTKGHTLPTLTSYGTFKPRKAGEALTTRFEVPITGVLDGGANITPLQAQLAVMVQADGNVRTEQARGLCVRFGFSKPRKIERCKTLLAEAGIEFTEAWEDDVCRIRVGAAHYAQLTQLVGPYKQFDKELWDAPATVKEAFVSELAHWDGDVEPQPNGFTYSTTDSHNAQFVATMAHLVGRAAFVSERERQDNWSNSYRVYIRRETKTRSEPKHYEEVPFKGTVYCPTTETGYFMVRQNGHIVVTGNTGRWGGNNKMNMQNLKRGGELRLAILAAPGHKLAVVDSGQIEARVNAWLWGEKDLLEAFRTGRDIYSEFASDSVYHRTITKADKTERHVGKTSILGLGFQMGAEKFQMTLAKGALGGPKVVFTLSAARAIVNAYRSKYYMIAGGWKLCAQMIEDMACGVSGWHKCIRWSGDGDGGGIIELPNGLSLKYPDLRKSRGDRGWDEWSYQSGDVRKKIYGGLLCLGASTEVLTDTGWKSIVSIREEDKLWDGVTWVSHSGLVHQGAKETINFGGVDMTPDHEVMVNNLWYAAKDTTHHEATSSFERHYWAPSRDAHSGKTAGERRATDAVGPSVPMWEQKDSVGHGVHQGAYKELWVRDIAAPVGGAQDARDVTAPGVRRLALDAGPLRSAVAPVLGKLRWAGHNCLFAVAELSNFLARHASRVQTWLGVGQTRQLERVRPGQLPLGREQRKQPKPQVKRPDSDARRPYAIMAGGRNFGGQRDNFVLPEGQGLAGGQDVRQAERAKQDVYDLLNAGPRRRFTVRGTDKRPFIVHNCENLVQALARIVVADQMVAIDKKYPVVMTTHDECVAHPKAAHAEKCFDYMMKCMTTAPHWCADMPLAAEGGFDDNYSK